jgi:serine O-acetyltransferase
VADPSGGSEPSQAPAYEVDPEAARRAFWAARRTRHPTVVAAVVADARITAQRRGDRYEFRGRVDTLGQCLRLMGVSDAFAAQVLYRLKAGLQAREVPVLPRLCHRLAMMVAQVSIGDPVVVEPGIYFAHGQVVIDGVVEIGSGTAILPWVTIGLLAGSIEGPTIGRNVMIGTGAKLIGPIRVGNGARIGANAVVLEDVPAGATVVGIPARVLEV